MVRILTVLKSGGEYEPEHAIRLARQFESFGYNTTCLSDMDVPGDRISLEHDWPGWWSKMEIFRTDIEGDIFYIDLDSTLVGDPAPLFSVKNITMLRQNYNPEGLGSGVMFWPEGTRQQVWDAWVNNPTKVSGGDQAFIQKLGLEVDRWQDVRPGALVSYKCEVRGKGVPHDARVVYFHGKPRPWHVAFEYAQPA